MKVAYRIETARLVLRCFRPEDAVLRKEAIDASLAHLAASTMRGPKDADTMDYQVARVRKARGMFDLDQDHLYAVLEASERRLLGEVGLMTRAGHGARELGYWTRADEVRKGIASEAVSAIVRIAFDLLEVDRLDLRCTVDNVASAAVAHRAGFLLEGTLRQLRLRPDDPPTDHLAFSMTRGDYASRPNASVVVRAFDFAGATLL